MPEPEPEPEPMGDDDGLDGYNWDEDMLFGTNPPPLQVLGAYSELQVFEMDEFEPPIRCAALPDSSACLQEHDCVRCWMLGAACSSSSSARIRPTHATSER